MHIVASRHAWSTAVGTGMVNLQALNEPGETAKWSMQQVATANQVHRRWQEIQATRHLKSKGIQGTRELWFDEWFWLILIHLPRLIFPTDALNACIWVEVEGDRTKD